jgi:hypothetical protein
VEEKAPRHHSLSIRGSCTCCQLIQVP